MLGKAALSSMQDPDKTKEAAEILTGMGLSAKALGTPSLSLSVSGRKEAFEKVFSSEIEPDQASWRNKIVIPVELEDYIEDVVIPPKPTYFEE